MSILRGIMETVYRVKQTSVRPKLLGKWDGPIWNVAETIEVAHFLRHSSDHHPNTLAKLLYDDHAIYGIFKVWDRYVRCRATEFQGDVWTDSCVELFVQPEGAKGYFNLEMNCGGTCLCSYMIDPTRVGDTHKEFIPLSEEDGARIYIFHSLPKIVDPEIEDETEWVLEFALPFSVLAKYAGALESPRGRTWRANLFKCAEEVSHPHWASWAPVRRLHHQVIFVKDL